MFRQPYEEEFSTYTRDRLERAGWYPARHMDVGVVKQHLIDIGYEVFPKVEEFLIGFHGLKVMDEKFPSHYALDFDILHPYDFQQPSFTEAALYYTMEKHKLQVRYEEKKGRFCFIGRTEISGLAFLTMDRDGCVYRTESDKYFDLVGLNAIHAIENLLSRQKPEKDVEYFYKRLAPYNQDWLYEIFQSNPVIVSCGHHNSPFGVFKSGYEVDRFLRHVGYRVYTVNLSPEEIDDTSDTTIYRAMSDVPEPIDIVTYHTPDDSRAFAVIEAAKAADAKIVFPSYSYQSPKKQARAEELGLEFIEGIGIIEAYQRLIGKDHISDV